MDTRIITIRDLGWNLGELCRPMWTTFTVLLLSSGTLLYSLGVTADVLATAFLPLLMTLFVVAILSAYRSKVVVTDQVEFRGLLKSIVLRSDDDLSLGLVMTGWWSEPVLVCTRGAQDFVLPVVPARLFDEFYTLACAALQRQIPVIPHIRRVRWRWGWKLSQ